MARIKVNATVRLNAYAVISDHLEPTIMAGVNRVYKHSDNPSREQIAEEVHRYVMIELSELLDFGGGDD